MLIVGSMAVSAIVHAGQVASGCADASCAAARTAVPVLAVVGWVAVAAAVARLVGPLVVSPPVAASLLASPVDRAGLLRPQLLIAGAASGVVAGAVLVAVALLAGWSAGVAIALGVAAGLLTVLVYAAGAARQAGPPGPPVLAPAAGLALTAGLVAVGAGAAEGLRPPTGAQWWLVPIVAAAAAGSALVVAVRRLDRLRRRDLVRGHGLAAGVSGALSGLDLALAYDVVLGQSARRRASVRSRRGRWAGPWALAWADLSRLRRTPGRVVVLAATVAVPYALHRAGLGDLTVPLAVVAAFVAALPLLPGLRVLGRSAGLARALGNTSPALRVAALAVPLVLLAAFGLACAPALPGHDPMRGLAVGVGAAASAVRWVSGRPPDYGRPLMASPFGAVPTNLYGSAVRGLDIAALVSAPMLLGAGTGGAVASLAISAIVLAYFCARR